MVNHKFSNFTKPVWIQGTLSNGDQIKNDVWIANNVTILDGVEIGNSSFFSADSIVLENMPKYSIFTGAPVKVIRPRER